MFRFLFLLRVMLAVVIGCGGDSGVGYGKIDETVRSCYLS